MLALEQALQSAQAKLVALEGVQEALQHQQQDVPPVDQTLPPQPQLGQLDPQAGPPQVLQQQQPQEQPGRYPSWASGRPLAVRYADQPTCSISFQRLNGPLCPFSRCPRLHNLQGACGGCLASQQQHVHASRVASSCSWSAALGCDCCPMHFPGSIYVTLMHLTVCTRVCNMLPLARHGPAPFFGCIHAVYQLPMPCSAGIRGS